MLRDIVQRSWATGLAVAHFSLGEAAHASEPLAASSARAPPASTPRRPIGSLNRKLPAPPKLPTPTLVRLNPRRTKARARGASISIGIV